MSLEALVEALGPGAAPGVDLARFTAMRVGGPAEVLAVVESADELARTVNAAEQHGVPWHVLGGGCNVLVSDRGIQGLVIINRAMALSFHDTLVRAQSGTKLAFLAARAVESGLAGMTWAVGLPGTIGGAIAGNAGAFDGDIARTLRSATMLEPGRGVVERGNTWFDFEYRSSRLKREGDRSGVVLVATFQLEPGDSARLKEEADEVVSWRKRYHPSGPTMGSTFKNPPGAYAGELIDGAGLKGYRVGDAMISEDHANFVINVGEATAADVLDLIRHVQREVERRFGVQLALEIELLGW
jgi:UDP-N-acetylmuramate dehydrogenase